MEFGVQDYLESSTRFLVVKDHWSGLVIDGSAENVEKIRRSEIYWQHRLRAECAFITRDNINDVIRLPDLPAISDCCRLISTATIIGFGRRSTSSSRGSS